MLPSGYSERPANPADLLEVTELLIATDIAEYGEPDWSEEDQRSEWANPRLDLSLDTRLVRTAAGAAVAYAYVTCRDDGADFDSDIFVHPDHDALSIEEHLMHFVEARAAEQVLPSAERPRLTAVVHAANTARVARYVDAGFTLLRHFWRMTVALPAGPPEHSPPDHVTIRPYAGPHELPVVHRVVTDAFRGHFRSVERTYDEWVATSGRNEGSSDPWLLADVGGETVGVLLASAAIPGLGWIRSLAVLEHARGQGIGLALLHRAFAEFEMLGAHQVSLGVDAENESGAVGLYLRAGMSVERQHDFYEKVLLPGGRT